MNVHFLCEVTAQRRQEVCGKLERAYGNVRCDVHGEQLRIVVSTVYGQGSFLYRWEACCAEFDLTLSLEHDREFQLHLWNEWYPYDSSRART